MNAANYKSTHSFTHTHLSQHITAQITPAGDFERGQLRHCSLSGKGFVVQKQKRLQPNVEGLIVIRAKVIVIAVRMRAIWMEID